MDILTLDLRVHEVEAEGLTTFYIVKRQSQDPLNDYVAVMKTSTADSTNMRDLAHLLANAPDMQRTGRWHLEQKRYADPALFANLHFTEVSPEEFEKVVGPLGEQSGPSAGLEDQLNKIELPDRQVTEFPATYDHATDSTTGIADMNVADRELSESVDLDEVLGDDDASSDE